MTFFLPKRGFFGNQHSALLLSFENFARSRLAIHKRRVAIIFTKEHSTLKCRDLRSSLSKLSDGLWFFKCKNCTTARCFTFSILGEINDVALTEK